MGIYHAFKAMSFYDKVLVVGGISDLLIGALILWVLLWRNKQRVRLRNKTTKPKY